MNRFTTSDFVLIQSSFGVVLNWLTTFIINFQLSHVWLMRSSVFYPRIQKTMNQSLPFVVTEFGCANAFPMIFLLLFRYLYPSWKHDINDMHLLQVCLHVRFLAKPSLLLPAWISHYTCLRFYPCWISATIEEGDWVKFIIWCNICIRITEHIHTSRIYINSPLGGVSKFDEL